MIEKTFVMFTCSFGAVVTVLSRGACSICNAEGENWIRACDLASESEIEFDRGFIDGKIH
jgi:hypothetical protein